MSYVFCIFRLVLCRKMLFLFEYVCLIKYGCGIVFVIIVGFIDIIFLLIDFFKMLFYVIEVSFVLFIMVYIY